MANSTSISIFKKNVMDALTNDDAIFYAFDAKECENGGDLIGTHILTYNKVPDTVTEVSTYMTIMAHTQTFDRRDRNKTFVIPRLEFYIYSHYKHMKMDRKITKDNRCDYISMLIDNMFNGSSEYGGIGELKLALNEEGAYNKDFLYRHMIFETVDLNKSFCEDE